MNQTILENEKMVKDARKKFICKKIIKGFFLIAKVAFKTFLKFSEMEKKRALEEQA